MVEQAVEANHAYAAQHEVEYRITTRPDTPLPVQGDADRLIQVLTNLLSNAAKFSPAGSAVEVAVETVGRQARISVQDRGIGFDAGQMARLFEPFYTTKASGMGMGLAISRSIIAAHGRRLWAEANPGPGATFSFTLPAAGAAAAA